MSELKLNKNAEPFVPASDELKDIDYENGLVLTHFNNCDNFSSQSIKEKRGVITDMSGNLVCKSFNFIEEYTPSQVEKMEFDFKNYKFVESHEGTIVRLFNHNNRWFLSTHKKIDAFQSRWGSKQSFGDMFVNALIYEYKEGQLKGVINCENDNDVFDTYCSKLNPMFTYCYLIKNTLDNRIVCDAPTNPTILTLGIFYKNGTPLEDVKNITHIQSPVELTFKTIGDLTSYVNNVYYKKIQGVLVYKDGVNLLKVLNTKYHELYSIRGNQPSLKFRYLQIRKQEDLVKKLIQLYPYKESRFEFYENNFRMLSRFIYNAYVKRFINKEYIVLEKPQYALMMTVHSKYLQNGTKITQELIYNTINDLDPSKLMSLLRSIEKKKE